MSEIDLKVKENNVRGLWAMAVVFLWGVAAGLYAAAGVLRWLSALDDEHSAA